MYALAPQGTSCSLEPSQVGSVERLWFASDSFLRGIGYIGEWDLSSGDLIEHNLHDGSVYHMALSGARIVTCDSNDIIRVLDLTTCLLRLSLYLTIYDPL